MINPSVFNNIEFLKEGLKHPFLVIPDALTAESAEKLYSELMRFSDWEHQSLTGSGFIYQRNKIGLGSALAPSCVNELFAFLSSPKCLQWVNAISGRKCDSFHGAAAFLRPGDQISEHNDHQVFVREDGVKVVRAVTFNYYLTKHWDERWGGRFVWKNPHVEVVPTFNTLVLFNVGSDSNHWVEPIAQGVEEKRLAITGWFLSSLDKPDVPRRKLNLKI